MAAWSLGGWSVVAVAIFLSAALCTRLAIAYAQHRQLIDQPGQRRSHRVATPRGGGIGIVVGVLFAVAAIAATAPAPDRAMALSVLAAIVVVAGVGWIDDHGSLRARPRFAAHCLAAGILLASLAMAVGVSGSEFRPGALLVYMLAAVAPGALVVWSINLHNFMDGIDGLLAMQVLFVSGSLALSCLHAGHPGEAGAVALLAAATAGFLPFNFPRARIFMGDVGSGVLGLLIAVAVGWQMLTPGVSRLTGIVLASAFVTDATCTLLSRMLRGRRWYSAHREHLYQWLARSGFSHAQVVALYMGWNVLIVLPAVCWMSRAPDARMSSAIAPAVVVYSLAVSAWLFGKRWCLATATARGRHAA